MKNDDDTKHPAFQDIGQITVDFLGQQIVIGCIEGEEANNRRLAEQVEIDAGEVMKAVSASIKPIQAMLMAAILKYDELEQARRSISDQ